MRLIACIGVIGLTLWSMPGASQRFQTLNESFPMGLAEELYQDTDGLLWIGTVGGLVRYDGYNTFTYTHDPRDSISLAGNNINAISEDGRGRLWVGLNDYGLNLLDTDRRNFVHVPLPALPKNGDKWSVLDICRDPDGEDMWVATSHGLLRFSDDTLPKVLDWFVHSIDSAHSLQSNVVFQLLPDSRGRLWVGTLRGLHRFDREVRKFYHSAHHPDYPEKQIVDIAEDRAGRIWVSARSTDHHISYMDANAGKFVPDTILNDYPLSECRFAFDLQDRVWLTSRGVGLYNYHPASGEITFFDPGRPALHGYRNPLSLQPLVDRYGNLWVAGVPLQVRPATGKVFQHIDTDGQSVISLHPTGRDLWYSTDQLMRYDTGSGEHIHFWPTALPRMSPRWLAEGPARKTAYDIQPWGRDSLLITTTRNIYLWDIRRSSFREYPLDYGGPFRKLIPMANKSHVYICGNQGSPIRLDLRSGVADRPAALAVIRGPQCGIRTEDGVCWFGTADLGVFRYDPHTGDIRQFFPDHPNPDLRLSDYYVYDLLATPDGVWAATHLGVNRISHTGDSVVRIRRQGVFVNENVLALQADTEGHIWMATQQGLVRYDPASHTFVHYDRSDGLINTTYSRGAAAVDGSGRLYFGGENGIDIVKPDHTGVNPVPPDLYVSGIMINRKAVDTLPLLSRAPHLELGFRENFIELELLAIHLTSPGANRYAYRMPGLDTAWRDLGPQRLLTLANIRPGSYTVEARAANADGLWSTPLTVLTFKIRPPVWQTWWFLSCGLLAILGMLSLGYRYHVRQIRTRESLRSAFNRRMAELESKALRAQMNPHFLFNSINSVKSLIAQGESAKATLYLTRFGQLIRLVLANSEKPLVRLQEELEALRLYLEIEQLRFQNFSFRIDVGDEVNADYIDVPPLILQPYVENAIWHGLMHKEEGDRRVLVSLGREGDNLRMSVEDNGIGRARAGQMKMLGRARKGGMGMRVTGDRLGLLREMYGQDVTVSVSDLAEGGTRVVIRIPWQD